MGDHCSARAQDALPCRRILLVEKHPVVLEGLAQLLRRDRDMGIVRTARSAADALAACRAEVPDLAVVDLALADGSGGRLARRMRTLWPQLRILVLSAHGESVYAGRMLRAGMRGYIVKHNAHRHIVAAVRSILAGDTYLSAEFEAAMRAKAQGAAADRTRPDIARLSPREREVFELIGLGLRKGEIAARLGRSVNTVEAHRASIKKKLDIDSATQLARVAVLRASRLE